MGRVEGEAVRILASGPGNLLFNWEVVVGVGQIWIGKLKLLPCFKTLPLGTKSLFRFWRSLMVNPLAMDVEFLSKKGPNRVTGPGGDPVKFFSLYLS